MYIVKRGFRNLGVMLTVGTEITDPTVIKHFKSRLGAGDIIVVTEHNYDTCKAFFEAKYGVTIRDISKSSKPIEATDKVTAASAAEIIHEAVKEEPVKVVASAKATVKTK